MAHLIDRTDLLTLSEAVRRLPGRPHRSTLWRWARHGIVTAAGERVRLRVHRLGRRVLVAPEDIDAFSAAVSEADRAAPVASHRAPRPKVRRRSTRHEQAEREARKLGI